MGARTIPADRKYGTRLAVFKKIAPPGAPHIAVRSGGAGHIPGRRTAGGAGGGYWAGAAGAPDWSRKNLKKSLSGLSTMVVPSGLSAFLYASMDR